MSKLKDLKLAYQKINTQFILTNNKGVVLESDSILFSIKTKSLIYDIHPFFLSVNINEDSNFTCVHLNISDKKLICDIQIKQIEKSQCLIILSDFSKHYNSFQSLAQSRNESALKEETTTIKNKLLLEQEAFKNKFIANFSHEIISPIMSIMTFSNVLLKSNLNQEQTDYANVINSSVYHLKDMVNDVLDLARIETNNLTVINQRFSLKRLSTIIKTEYAHKCKQKGIDLNVVYDEHMPKYVVSDKRIILQILKNLLDNALKFTNEGSITVKFKPIYKRARHITFLISVSDTGIGIDLKKQDVIFNRFTRLDESNKTKGVGLGLTIVKELIPLLNGTIELESEINKGSTFTINIRAKTPLIDKEKEEVKPIQTKDEIIKILLVENNLQDQLSIFKILAKNKTFFLDIASSGAEAINLIQKTNYHLILMDYNMPKLNGLQTSKRIKKIKPEISILLITGAYMKEKALRSKDHVYNNILNKPFDEETLLNSIYMSLK